MQNEFGQEVNQSEQFILIALRGILCIGAECVDRCRQGGKDSQNGKGGGIEGESYIGKQNRHTKGYGTDGRRRREL